jgi:hypothetical protein
MTIDALMRAQQMANTTTQFTFNLTPASKDQLLAACDLGLSPSEINPMIRALLPSCRKPCPART